MRFLDSTQRIEHLLDVHRGRSERGWRQGLRLGKADQRDPEEDLHAMWLAVHEVVITCSPATGKAANDYCEALYGQARNGVTDRSIKRLARVDFLDAARVELGQSRWLTE